MRCASRAVWVWLALASVLAGVRAAAAPPRVVDAARASSAGIRTLGGRHLVLYTDLPSDPEVDRLPADFDQAVPQWAEYFGVDQAKVADWQAQAYIIADRRRFDALGLMPADYEDFDNGVSVGSELWLHDQPTAYYRRHLLLHEGTHAFMFEFLGGCGPGWYMEGTAELLATHRLDDKTGRLTLRTMPRHRTAVPMLGRIKLVRDAFQAGHPRSFPAVMQIDNRRQLDNEGYAWCWAAAKFLDSHPRYRQRFRQLHRQVLNPKFNDFVQREFADDWEDLNVEWQAFVATLEHGYDFERMAIDFERGEPLEGATRRLTISAERGWQSSGVWLEAERAYRITSNGRYQIATEEVDGVVHQWPCEPGGVTLEYYDGRPLGILLGAIDARPHADQGMTFADPIAIGLGKTITPTESGTLYLRVNDSAGHLEDNRGTLQVRIEAKRNN